jgi:hypothetical protein
VIRFLLIKYYYNDEDPPTTLMNYRADVTLHQVTTQDNLSWWIWIFDKYPALVLALEDVEDDRVVREEVALPGPAVLGAWP